MSDGASAETSARSYCAPIFFTFSTASCADRGMAAASCPACARCATLAELDSSASVLPSGKAVARSAFHYPHAPARY